MIRTLFRQRKFVGLLCAAVLGVETVRHLFFLMHVISYTALWGHKAAVNVSLLAGEAISCGLLFLFTVSIIILSRHHFIITRKSRKTGRKLRVFKRAPGFWVLVCRIATAFVLLLFVGYLRAGNLKLRIGMSCLMAVLFLLLIVFQRTLARDYRRCQQRFRRKRKKHR